MNVAILMGPPYSGKGTQGKLLSKSLGYIHLATGDVLRTERKSDSQFAQQIKEYEKRGDLLPDSVIIPFFENRILNSLSEKGIVLDGYPRSVAQVNSFVELVTQNKMKIIALIELIVPEDELLARAKIRSTLALRLDDMDSEIHKKRIHDFKKITLPAIEALSRRFKLIHINGYGTIDEIAKMIECICLTK